eukprot:122116_1
MHRFHCLEHIMPVKFRYHVIYLVLFVMSCYLMVLYNINTYIGTSNDHIQTPAYVNHPNNAVIRISHPQTDLLMIMIDNRYTLLNNHHQMVNLTYLHESYFYYSFCINLLYAHHHKYTLLLIDPYTNDSTHACNPMHYTKNELVPMEW